MYNFLVYEWDERKRLANIEKHGLDFVDAYLVYENVDKVTIQSIHSAEPRLQDLALVEVAGVVLSLVYVLRGNSVRVISFRRAGRRERSLYANITNED
jgi:uncharacterized DUF497 family protein